MRMKQRFLYLFDFGDEHTFELQLLGASPEPGRFYTWRIVEEHGEMPPRRGEWDDEEAWDDDEEALDEEEDSSDRSITG